MIGILLAAALVTAPAGWREVADGRFVSPNDPYQTLVVEHVESGRITAADVVAQIERDPTAAIESHTQRTVDGVELHDVVYRSGGLRRHLVVASSRHEDGTELVAGTCAGLDKVPECDAALGELRISGSRDDYSKLDSILYIGAGVITALLVLGFGVRELLRRRDLRRSQKLLDGELVTLAGMVVAAGAQLEAPLTGTRCVVHRSRARVFANDSTATVVAEPLETAAVSFDIDTQHGRVRVDARDIDFDMPPNAVVYRPTPQIMAFRARHAIDDKLSASYEEIVIAPGRHVTIRGVISVEQDAAAQTERGYRDDAPWIARLVSSEEHKVTISRTW